MFFSIPFLMAIPCVAVNLCPGALILKVPTTPPGLPWSELPPSSSSGDDGDQSPIREVTVFSIRCIRLTPPRMQQEPGWAGGKETERYSYRYQKHNIL